MIKKISQKIYTFVCICVVTIVFALFTVSCGNPCEVDNYVSADNKYTPITINYATCTLNDGCDITFQCKPTTSKTAAFFNSVHDIFRNANKLHAAAKIPQDFAITSVASVKGTEQTVPAPLQKDFGPVPSSWYVPSHKLPCTMTNGDITCKNFAPISNEMYVEGTVFNRPVKFYITVDTSKIKKSAPGKVTICGQYGVNSKTSQPSDYSTSQRVFDCSVRVTDFAGLGNGNGTFTAFEPGYPDNNWFLTACFDTNIEHCSWLTPIIPNSNATGEGQYLSTVNGKEGALTSTLIGKRILFSGLLASNYNFFEANGRNPWNIPAGSTTQGQYDYYYYHYYASVFPGKIIPRYVPPDLQMCAPSTAGCITGHNIAPIIPFTPPVSLDFIYTSSPATIASICERQTGQEGALLSSYTWQVPSYPILIMITGGKSSEGVINKRGYCESDNVGFKNNLQAYCVSTANNTPPYLGFRATDPIPSFQTEYIMSSSVLDENSGWAFNGTQGSLDRRYMVLLLGVRCITPVTDL